GKAGFLADKLSVYEDLIGFLYKQAARDPEAGYDRQAFEYVERAKARVFLDLLAESKAGVHIPEGIDPAFLRRERDVQAQISDAQIKLNEEYLKPTPDERYISRIGQERDVLYRMYEELKQEMRQKN